ncbi:MAG: CopG family transcriptional regulator [Thermoanaerobaculia bacterium]
MKRTTIYLGPELEAQLKAETLRRNQSMAELIREAVREHIVRSRPTPPPGAGEFASGRADTAARSEEILAATGFGARR